MKYILFFRYCKGKEEKNIKKIRQKMNFLYDTPVIPDLGKPTLISGL